MIVPTVIFYSAPIPPKIKNIPICAQLICQTLVYLMTLNHEAHLLNCSGPPAKKHYLTVTDELGVVRIFDIPRIIYCPSKNEVRRFHLRNRPLIFAFSV